MMEFGHLYIRFYANHGQLQVGGAPLEVATPYSWSDLTAADGTFRLRVAQSADVMYLFHRNFAPRKLLRTGALTFSLQTAVFSGGPFQTINADKGVTVTASGQTGAVTLTANTARFNAAHVGGLFYLESKDFSAVKPWEVQKLMTVGELRRVDSRVYLCTTVGTVTNPDRPDTYTGSKTPTHTEGRAWDGDGLDVIGDGDLGPIGVEWEYQHSGYGIVRVDGFVSSTQVTGTVLSMLPADVVSAATYKWADPMFWDAEGWPEHGVFWRERLVLARDRKIAMSVTADFENFAAKDPDEVQADSAITQTLNARQINRILWMVEADDLVIGTNGDEWVIGPIQNNQAVGPTNIRAAKRTIYGSKSIQPAEVGGRILFVQASGKKLRDYMQKVLGRELFGTGYEGASRSGAALAALRNENAQLPGLIQLVLSSTLLGYGSMALKDLAKGRTPRDPIESPEAAAKVMLAALVQGGGAGIYGDFLFGESNRFGGGFLATAAGPGFSAGASIVDLYQRAVRGEAGAAETIQTMLGNTPYANLFYARIAADYLFMYGLQESINPGYLRRMERRIEEQNGQQFLLRPSQSAIQF
ncbi:hypothetical protein [Achromobacter sp.]|uniref:hypothetical protein n=1 Tax=Achromobacter sp. TaxID=134375 RepID=UPI000ECDB29B|nr:hypothetical protein [Achromobacter sp.]HCW16865.1 hypothetical protein [Achromobacter sp.]